MNYSVLMSIYHKEKDKNLYKCFESIQDQTLPPYEIVLVLDGKLTKELYSTIEYWSNILPLIKISLDNNVGLGTALNIGLKHCKCNLIARMDTDDICLPFRFEKQIGIFKKDPNIDICGSFITEFEETPRNILSIRKVPTTNETIRRKCIWSNPFNHMTVMYKKSAVEDAGGYLHLPLMEDWYLWLRMISNNCRCLNISDSLVMARTGVDMIERRRGFRYIKSEWDLTKIKVSLSLSSWPKSIFIFVLRSIPRLIPKKLLRSIYLIARKTS